jgi:hypothetical protein
MAEAENFLGRWSRLKQEARVQAEAEAEPLPETEAEALPEVPDLASLPPVESLDAASDYTAFLKDGVPEELKRLALRKAWASDPAIAGFRGLCEYDWDCNAPGYGALLPVDDVAKLCRSVLEAVMEEKKDAPPEEREVPPPLLEAPGEVREALVATALPPGEPAESLPEEVLG